MQNYFIINFLFPILLNELKREELRLRAIEHRIRNKELLKLKDKERNKTERRKAQHRKSFLKNKDIDKEKEDWYKSAWIYTTKQVLDHYKIKEDSIPEEEVPLEFIKELQKEDNKVWNIESNEEVKEEVKEEKPKKLLKKKNKKLPKKVEKEKEEVLGGYKSKQEVRSAYIAGEIDISTYKKYMKALKS